MGVGKVVLLLIAGGLGGAAFAAMTTDVMAPYHTATSKTQVVSAEAGSSYTTPSHAETWLQRGYALFNFDEGPTDHGAHSGPQYQYDDEYEPYSDGQSSYSNRGLSQSEQHYGNRRYDDEAYDYGDTYTPEPDTPNMSAPAHNDAQQRTPPTRPIPTQRQDQASDAAQRAANAAQDVLEAERGY